jgi:hypothetical protein
MILILSILVLSSSFFYSCESFRALTTLQRIMSRSATRRCADRKMYMASPTIFVSRQEQELFDILLSVVRDLNLNTTIRIAGGWVRDHVLSAGNVNHIDVDIALENMTGVEFAGHWREWQSTHPENANGSFGLSVIPRNCDKSKHLETGTVRALLQPGK